MSLPAVLVSIISLIPGLGFLKKKPYCLWIRKAGRWENANPGGNSARRCGIAAKAFVKSGVLDADLMILPKGINPP